jgi:hypothetical protein
MPRPTTMNLSEAVVISASSLWAHKLRSVLTLIGMVIGVLFGSRFSPLMRYGLNMPPVLSLFWIATALIMCALIGIVSASTRHGRPPASTPSKLFATNNHLSACGWPLSLLAPVNSQWTKTIPQVA